MNIKYYTLKNGVLPRTFLNSGRLTKKHEYECKIFVMNLKVLNGLPSYENNHFIEHWFVLKLAFLVINPSFIILCDKWWE